MPRRTALIATSAALALALGGGIAFRLAEGRGEGRQRRERGPAAVRVADIVRGPIEERRVFTGTLEASARFTVAAQRAGCLLYTSPSPRDLSTSRMPSSA